MIRRLSLSLLLMPVILLAACGGSSSTPPTSPSGATSGANSLSTATAAESASSTQPVATDSSNDASPASAASGGSSATGTIQFTLHQTQSQALYKARETLANIGSPTEAVGKTSHVSGMITFSDNGAIDASASKITIDLSTLQSDKSQRDNYIKRNTLNTSQYPDAVFVPTDVQGLSWPLPASGQLTFKLIGNLTVRGQTSQTTWDVSATAAPPQVKGSATTTVKFEDFGMKPPRTMLVLGVEDNLTLELDFVFTRAG